MGYAVLVTVKLMLNLADVNPNDDAAITRIVQINDEMSRLVEIKTGRAWGTPSVSEARVIPGNVNLYDGILLLPTPIRSVTSIVITGDWAETVPGTDYVPTMRTRRGDYLALRKIQGSAWPLNNGRSTITVTGVWSDGVDGETVPLEIVEAVNFLTVEQYKLEVSSPAGEIGPDGLTIRPRNPWNFDVVKTAIDRYRVALPVASF